MVQAVRTQLIRIGNSRGVRLPQVIESHGDDQHQDSTTASFGARVSVCASMAVAYGLRDSVRTRTVTSASTRRRQERRTSRSRSARGINLRSM